MSMSLKQSSGILKVRISGELTVSNSQSYLLSVKKMKDSNTTLTKCTVDLSAVQHIDESGIGFLLGCKNIFGANDYNKTFTVINPSMVVNRVLTLSGAKYVLTIEEDK